MEFKITVDISQVAEKLNSTRELLEDKLTAGVKAISAATHAFIINKASELDSFKRDAFLGTGKFGKDAQRESSKDPNVDSSAKYVRWIEISKGLWIVEIDPKAAWIEEGRGPTSMATEQWLLKPGKAKRAKDGSLYRSIPFTHSRTGQARGKHLSPVKDVPIFRNMINRALADVGLPKKGLIMGAAGPKVGLIAKLNIKDPGIEGLRSKPRSAEDAAKSGLKPHAGIFLLQGAAVYQRKDEKTGKFTRETVVFRTVSSKHANEGRWMAPAVAPFNSMKAASEYAQKQVDDMIKAIGEEIRRVG